METYWVEVKQFGICLGLGIGLFMLAILSLV